MKTIKLDRAAVAALFSHQKALDLSAPETPARFRSGELMNVPLISPPTPQCSFERVYCMTHYAKGVYGIMELETRHYDFNWRKLPRPQSEYRKEFRGGFQAAYDWMLRLGITHCEPLPTAYAEDIVIGLYEMALGVKYEHIETVYGFPTCNKNTWKAICELFTKHGRKYLPPRVMPGGYWMNYGFSSQGDDLADWEVRPCSFSILPEHRSLYHAA